LAILVCFSQRADGASLSLIMAATGALLNSLIFGLSIRRGVGGVTTLELVMTVVAGGGVVGWLIADEPVVAMGLRNRGRPDRRRDDGAQGSPRPRIRSAGDVRVRAADGSGRRRGLVTDEAVLAEVARLLGERTVAVRRSSVIPSGLRRSGFSSGRGDPRPSGVVVGLDLHGHDRIVLRVEEPAGWIAAAIGGHH
jgi:hypothetical protein